MEPLCDARIGKILHGNARTVVSFTLFEGHMGDVEELDQDAMPVTLERFIRVAKFHEDELILEENATHEQVNAAVNAALIAHADGREIYTPDE